MSIVAVPTLVASIGCRTRPRHQLAQRATWGSALTADVRFFVGAGAAVDETVVLDADDSYDGLAQKTWALAHWALERGYEWVFKVNDDVLIRPSVFRLPPLTTRYAGWDQEGRGTWLQGHAYWLHREALEIIAAQPKPAVLPSREQVEDRWVGRVLTAAGVPVFADPGIGQVQNAKSVARVPMPVLLDKLTPYYAAAEFTPEQLVQAFQHLTPDAWQGFRLHALRALARAPRATSERCPWPTVPLRRPRTAECETVECPPFGGFCFLDGVCDASPTLAALLVSRGLATADHAFAVPVGVMQP